MSFALIDQMMIDEGAKNSQRGGVHYYGGLDHFDQFLGGTDCV